VSPSTTTRTWGRTVPVRSSSKRVMIGILLVVIAVAAVALGQRLPAPTKAPTITIDNPTDYAMTIEASGSGHEGWVGIVIVEARGTTTATEVVDQGSNWSLRITSQGHVFDEIEVSREQLSDAGWRYTVPSDIGDQLAEAGVPQSP
jgi:hypothetical protein